MLKELLKGDHARLLDLLDKFLEDKSEKSLIVFIGNIRRHMNLENEVIYKLSENKALTAVNKKILEDHKNFFNVINAAEAVEFESLDIDSLKDLRAPLRGHNGYEDVYFYPVLEKILSTDQVADLMDKVKDEINFA